jgi:uncharacterized membrane protein YqjE
LKWREHFLEKKQDILIKKYWLHLDIIIVRVKEKHEKGMEILLLFSLAILLADVYLATIQLQQLYIYIFFKKKSKNYTEMIWHSLPDRFVVSM